jgi:hypothetical protein
VASATDGVTQGAQDPEQQSHDEHNHSNRPQDRNPRDKSNDEKNQSEKDHVTSAASRNAFLSRLSRPDLASGAQPMMGSGNYF